MNFSPFGGPFPASIPGIHQFAASGALNSTNPQVCTVPSRFRLGDDFNRFRLVSFQDSNRYNASSANLVNIPHFNQSHSPLLSKFRSDGSSSGGGVGASGNMLNKYNGHSASNSIVNTSMSNDYSIPSYTQSNASAAHHHTNQDEKNHRLSSSSYHQSNMSHQSQMPELTQDLCNALLNQQTNVDAKKVLQNVNTGWQSLAPSAAVADYLSQLPASTLPLSLHHFLKYSSESIKKEVNRLFLSLAIDINRIVANSLLSSP